MFAICHCSSRKLHLYCFGFLGSSLNVTEVNASNHLIIFTKFSLTKLFYCSLLDQDEISRLRTEVGALKEREESLKLQVSPLVL